MKTKIPKWFKISASLSAMILLMASSCLLLRPILPAEEAVSVFSAETPEHSAALSPQRIDGRTKLPIEGAVIVIPETNTSHVTNDQGFTAVPIRIPYRKASSELSEKDWCEVTLLVYADGYAPYALFYLQLTKDNLRQGPTIMLFPDQGKSFSIIEGPPQQWVEEIVEKYRP